jgi:hypothetical protein
MAPPRPRRRADVRSYVRVGAVAAAALAAIQLVRLAVRSPQAVAAAAAARSGLAAAPLVQRLVVPDLYAALEGVLREGAAPGVRKGKADALAVTVLDCGDGRWADVWPGGSAASVAVDSVLCVNFASSPDVGDGAAGDAAAAAAAAAGPASVPWLRHGEVAHVQHSPRGGSALGGRGGAAGPAAAASSAGGRSAAASASAAGGRKAAGGGLGGAGQRPVPTTGTTTTTNTIPRTMLALAHGDGQDVAARYVPFVASAMAVAGTRLVLVDAGNTPAPGDEAARPPKKPRTPGFQVLEAGGGGGGGGLAPSWPRSPAPRHRFYQLAMNTVQPTFSMVYETRLWGSDGGGSGTGSSLAATASLRASLADIIAKYKVKSFLDSSCGSMHWMPLVARAAHDADPDFRYTGTDAVCSLVESHHSTFANESAWMDFTCVDASHQPLPSGYDLVFSRDSLQHLPIASAYKFLHNVRASGAKYLLVGSYLTGGQRVTGGRNVDINVGDVYDIDLLQPPFNVRPPPLEVIKEDNPEQKFMLLLDVGRLAWDEDLALT